MSNLNLSSELDDLVSAREEIWNEYDRILDEAKQLNFFVHFDNESFDKRQTPIETGKLSPEQLPVIINELKRQEQIIIQSEKNIDRYHHEIARIKQKKYCAFGSAGIAATITLFILL